MKQNLFATVIIVLLSSFIVPLKKTGIKPAHPYFEYSFAASYSDGTPDINLDKSSAVYQQPKSKTAPTILSIAGAKSTVRLRSGISTFIAHPVTAGELATGTAEINLFKLNSDKKNRSLSIDATGVISATKIRLTIVQTDALTLKILILNDPTIPNSILSPGEYAFVEKNMAATNSTLTVWCFGID